MENRIYQPADKSTEYDSLQLLRSKLDDTSLGFQFIGKWSGETHRQIDHLYVGTTKPGLIILSEEPISATKNPPMPLFKAQIFRSTISELEETCASLGFQ